MITQLPLNLRQVMIAATGAITVPNIGDGFLLRAENIEVELSSSIGRVYISKWSWAPLISCTYVPLVNPVLSVG